MINKKRETISNKLGDFKVDLQDILDTVEEELIILAKLNTFENKLKKVFELHDEYQSELNRSEESMDDMIFLFNFVKNFVLQRNFKESNFFMAA